MKKGLVIGATLIMGVSLAACGNSEASKSSLKSSSAKIAKPTPKKINKNMSKVGVAQYKINSVLSEKVTNKESNYTDAENNLSDLKQLNHSYYRVTINYQLKNTGDKPLDMSYQNTSVIDDNGQDYTMEGNSDGFCLDEGAGGSSIQSGSSTSSSFILISNHKIPVNNFKLNVGDQVDHDGNTIATGGTATLQ
jgi:hypothetical protein